MTQQLTIEQLKFARSIGATHYDWEDGKYRKDGLYLAEPDSKWKRGIDAFKFSRYSEIQPIDFSQLDDSDPGNAESCQVTEPKYVPQVGEECESRNKLTKGDWAKITPDYVGHKVVVFKIGTEIDGVLYFSINEFRPLPDPIHQRREELMKKWRSQGLEYAHDTEKTQVSLGQVLEFIAGLEGE